MKFVAVVFGVASLVLTGCAGNSYCLGKQTYQGAEERPPLQSVEGLRLPTSATALKIPPAGPNPVPFGVADSAGHGVCLDKPPAMAQPASRPAAKAAAES